MMATAGKAFDIDDEDDWAFEMKWDGYRAVAVCDGPEVALFSRTGKDMTDTYPEVADALAAADLADTVLDGEIVALGPGGAPSFSLLQQGKGPMKYLVFDVLSHEGEGLKNETYEERRELLRGARPRRRRHDPGAATPSRARSRTRSRPARTSKLEGVVAKRRDSRYRSGTRSSSWIKIKHQQMQEAVIVGWRSGQGQPVGWRSGRCCSRCRTGTGWRYIGRVGTGFSGKVLDDLYERLAPLERKTAARRRAPRDRPRRPVGDARSSSARCSTASGRPTATCGIRCGAACARTRSRQTSGRSDGIRGLTLGGSSICPG